MNLGLDRKQWNRVKFGDVVRNVNESVKNPSAEGINRVIAMEHLDPGELRIRRWGAVADGTTFTRRVRPGQTLFGKRRAYQRKSAYSDFGAICSGDILVFEADASKLLPELLPFLVQSEGFHANAVGTSAGSLSPRTNWTDLAAFEFELPPIDQQQRVADLLWAIHRFRLAAIDLIDAARSVRLGAIDRFVEKGLATERLPLAEFAEIRGGIQKGKSTVGPLEEYPYLRVANVQSGRVELSDLQTLKVTPADAEKYALRNGDVLMTEGGDIDKLGRGTVWRGQVDPCLHQNHVFAVRVHDNVRPEWVSFHTESTAGRRYFRAAAKRTSNLASINKTQVSAFPIAVASLEDQDRQTHLIKSVEAASDQVESSVRELMTLRDSVLEELWGRP